MDYVGNNRNLVRDAVLSALNIVPSNSVFRTDTAPKAGGGNVTLSGDYDGQQDATYDVRVDDNSSSAPTVTNPDFSGVGNGVLSNLAISGVAPQTITVTLEDLGTATTFAYAPFQGLTLLARASGSGGNAITLTINQSALVATATDFALREGLEAGRNEYTGDHWNFGAATLTADGNVPASAPRLRFGDDPQVYRAYRYYRGGSYVYAFAPPPVRPVQKGTRVKLVTGSRTVTITDGASTDTLTGIVTLYDCLAAIRDDSTLIRFEGAVVNDQKPEGMGTVDLSVYTEPYIASIGRSGSDVIQETEFTITPDATAPSEVLTLTCTSNSRSGVETWKVRGDVSGTLPSAITGVPYTEGAYSFTIPRPVVAVGTGGIVRVEYRPRERTEGDNLPALCEYRPRLGALARNGQWTFTLVAEPPEPCDCADATSEGGPNDDCLGTTDGGDTVSTSDEYRRRRIFVDRWYKSMYALMRLNSAPRKPNEDVGIAVLNPARNMIIEVLAKIFAGIEKAPDTKWTASHPYSANAIIAPAGARNGYLYRTTGGTSASSEPTWPTDVGQTVTDNGMTWTCISLDAIAEWDDALDQVKQRLIQQIVSPTAKWAASRSYDHIEASTPPPYAGPVVPTTANGHRYLLVTPGTSGASAPTWPTNGATVTDGSAVWQDAGTYWSATTKVAEGEIISAYDAGLFECTQGGTTGASEPTWAAITLTDGSVHWKRIETPVGNYANQYPFPSTLAAQLRPLFAEALALAGVSGNFDSAGIETDGCWQDFGGPRFAYTGQEDPPYMPIFPGHYYHASRLTADSDGRPVIHSTQEWGFDPKFSCQDLLQVGDELVITVEGVAGGSNGYQVGDTVQAEVTRIGPTEFGGGQSGDDTLTWHVEGTVDSFAPYALVTTAIVDYSDGGLTLRITPGGVPFELGDQFEFDVEGPRIRWRKNGGGWSSQINLAANIALSDGLSANFAPGSAPSWVVDDQWGFSAEAVNGPENLRQPTDARCTWTGSTTITVTPAAPRQVNAVSLVDHDIPSNAVIRLQGSDDNFSTTPVDQVLAWRDRNIYVKGDFGARAKYRLLIDKGGSLSWLWLGDPFVPTIKTGAKELGKLTKQRRMPGLTTRSALGVKIEHTSLPQATVDDLLALLEHACEFDEGRFAVIPNPDEAEVGLVRFVAGTLDLDDVLGFQPRDTAHRLQSATLVLEACP